MQQSIFLGLGLIGAVGIFTALWFLPKLQEEQFLKESQLYEDTERGFSFRFPKAWEFVPKVDLEYKNEKFVVGVQHPATRSSAAGVIIEEKDPQKKLRFEYNAFKESLEQQLSTLQDFKELSIQQIERDGYPGIDISYTFKHASKAYVRERQLILFVGHSLYYLSGGTTVETYPLYRKDLEGIFQSFHMINGSSEIK
ncbi:MAG: hypothetical protein HYV65_02305 [Candidatus Spechtbacteria bacterium]|nr:hypothetical protein [Candidatus Spechtbacteria bacterium]